MTYGICPTCGSAGIFRERTPNGSTICINGHRHPHAAFDSWPGRAYGPRTGETMKVRDMLPAMFVHVLYSCFCRTIKVTLIEQSAIHFSLAQRSYHWSAGEGVREVVGLSVSETPWSRRIEAICEGKKRKEDGSYE